MSHVVSLQTKLHDPAAVAAACQRLNLALPREVFDTADEMVAAGWRID